MSFIVTSGCAFKALVIDRICCAIITQYTLSLVLDVSDMCVLGS
jgi:hypothetical protein